MFSQTELNRAIANYRALYIDREWTDDFKKKRSKLERYAEYYVPQREISMNWDYSKGQQPNWIKQLAYRCLNYQYSDFDVQLSITGEEGVGKSHFAVQLIKEIEKLDKGNISFSWKNSFFFEKGNMEAKREQLSEAMEREQKTIILVDESRGYLEKRDFASAEQIELIQAIIARRSNNNIVLWCIGDIRDLDIDFRERKVHEVVMIPDRGVFAVRSPKSLMVRDEDKFGLDEDHEKNFDYFSDINDILFADNTSLVGYYKPLEPSILQEYLEKKEASRKRSLRNRLEV